MLQIPAPASFPCSHPVFLPYLRGAAGRGDRQRHRSLPLVWIRLKPWLLGSHFPCSSQPIALGQVAQTKGCVRVVFKYMKRRGPFSCHKLILQRTRRLCTCGRCSWRRRSRCDSAHKAQQQFHSTGTLLRHRYPGS
jgi:hypothetical protein